MRNRLWASLVLISCSFGQTAYPCTSFLVSNGANFSVGKSFDWSASHAVAYLNTSGREKVALRSKNSANRPKTWLSIYGSLTFSQFGPEFPLSGMNEKGLVVEILWLPEASYPTSRAQKELNELQWIQYILDTSADTDEAIANAKTVQIKKIYANVHYLVCDSKKSCAVFEYIDGSLKEPKVLSTSPVLTNIPYDRGWENALNYAPFGGLAEVPQENSDPERFVKVAALVKALGADGNVTTSSSAEKILDSARAESTQWQIIYSPKNLTVKFKLMRTGAVTELSISNRTFDCSTKRMMARDISGDILGAVSERFEFYDINMTKAVLQKGSSEHNDVLSAEDIKDIARYTEDPTSFKCYGAKKARNQ